MATDTSHPVAAGSLPPLPRSLAGSRTVVVGGTQGWGAAAVRLLAGLGAHVIAAGRSGRLPDGLPVEADVTAVDKLRTAVKDEFLAKTGQKLSFLPFFALAAVEALQQYPIINATVDGDSIVYPDTENVSIAVDTERGLLTPVIRSAGGMSIADLAAQIADLAGRTRDNKLKPDELAGGTFTLTNTGSRGALFDTPLVFLPQVAILGTGAVVKKPAVVATADGGESIAIRSTVYLALSYDHRIVDGADAARFLTTIKQRLEAGDFRGSLGI